VLIGKALLLTLGKSMMLLVCQYWFLLNTLLTGVILIEMNSMKGNHINLLYKIAWSFHATTGLEVDDLFQEAYFAYEYALKTYDPDKGVKFSSFLWTHISNQLKTYYIKQCKITNPLVGLDSLCDISTNPEIFFEALTDDARMVADLVLATTKRFVELSRQEAKQRVFNIMRNRGWTYGRIHYALINLKVACSNT